LADNGGPTQTHLLLADSPALNTANFASPGSRGTACEATAQRRGVRPHNVRCDIGSIARAPRSVTHLAQADTTCAVSEPTRLAPTWTRAGGWRQLDTRERRLADDTGVRLWLRFAPAAGTFALVDPVTESAGIGEVPGSPAVRETELAAVGLE